MRLDPTIARAGALVDRFGVAVTLAVAAILLLAGLGRSGLWEPWEMDRADLARTLVEPLPVPVALAGDPAAADPAAGPGAAAVPRALVDAAAARAGVAPLFTDPPAEGARGVASGARTVREALDRARTEVVAAVAVELSLLAAPEAPAASWARAWEQLDEAAAYAPNGAVVLLAPGFPGGADAVARRLAVGRLAAGWEDLRRREKLDTVRLPDPADPAWDPHLGAGPPVRGLVVLVDPTEDALADAFADAAAATARVVQFKDAGRTYAVPPLRHRLVAAAYAAFGTSELTTRLPGALMALAVVALLVLVARRRYGPRVASLAGLVLVTTPLFYAQARSAAGEPEAMLGLTLYGLGLLELAHGAGARRVWTWLGAGLLVGFLAKGLTALAIFAVMAAGYALVTGSRDRREWAPALATGAALGLAALWVLTSPSDGFAGQFRFTLPLFSEGPTAYERNFDYAINHIGFGGFPWSPVWLVAFGALAVRLGRGPDRPGLVLLLWFAVPTVAVMGLLKDFNQVLWPAAPVAALGAALFLAEVARRGGAGAFVAFVLVMAGGILAKELGSSPQPLADFLAFDPPFADQAGRRFPEELRLDRAVLALSFLLTLPLVLHAMAGTLFAQARAVARFLARERPFALGVGAASTVLALTWFGRVLSQTIRGMRSEEANALSEAQRTWATRFLATGDPVVVLAWATLGVVVAVLVLRFLVPPLGRLLGRLAARLPRPAPRVAFRVGAFLLLQTGVAMLAATSVPDGYWRETLAHPAALFVVAAALVAAVAAFAAGRGVADALLAALAVGGVALAARLSRDAAFAPPLLVGLTLAGFAALATVLVPHLWRRLETFAFTGGLLAAVALLLLALPLMQRWDLVAPVVSGEGAEPLTRYLVARSRVSMLLYLALAGLLACRLLPALVRHVLAGAERLLARGPLVVASVLAAGLVFAVGLDARFYPSLAYHVSQKHILDTYRAAEGLSRGELGDRVFKHGSFGVLGRSDANFYTAGIPEIRDRATALGALLAERDQAALLETSAGTEARLVPGWAAANDADRDGRRDAEALHGVATAASPGRLVAADAAWTPGALAGRVLVDAAGRIFPITGNDATSLTLADNAMPSFSPSRPDRNVFAVDLASAPVHQATLGVRDRAWLLLPVESFSEINHAFRELAGGRHVPVVDGRSSRVLLAASWLAEGEEQQNRYANHTLSREEFDALGPDVHRAWANFDDKIRVVGYRMEEETVSRGATFRLTLYFECLEKIRTSYKIFMHIDRTGTSNRIHGDHWPLNLPSGDEEDKTCVGCYRTDHWMPGDVIVDVYEGEVPIGTPAGQQDIWMGFYTPGSDARLPVKSWEEGRVRHDGANRVRVGAFRVR